MKQFFKFFFASMLGTIVGAVVLFVLMTIVFFIVVTISISSLESHKEVKVKPNSILVIKLDYPVPDRTPSDPFAGFDFTTMMPQKILGLNDIIANIRKAKTDDNIKGIYLDLNTMEASMSMIGELRKALKDFKTSKKFIIAYGEVISQRAYYLGSVADKIYLNPTGYLLFNGLTFEMMYLKKTLAKLDIVPQVFRYGKYKSAVEQFTEEKMSKEEREQMQSLMGAIYNQFLTDIAEGRNLPISFLDSIASHLLIRKAEDAKLYQLVDQLYYEDEVQDKLRQLTGTDKKEKNDLNRISLSKYHRVKDSTVKTTKDRIAVVYATGIISRGESTDMQVGSETIVQAIRQARKNKNVKAIVLRINSPGGDVIASEAIWREVRLTKGKKPIIASMSTTAASGGYYIACAADTIVAQPNTITGSIGVFALLPNTEKFFENKLGITFDRIKTGQFADFANPFRSLTEIEKIIIQEEINRVYKHFVDRVAQGRNSSFEKIDAVGHGRVWAGTQAKDVQLIDMIGGLDDAIAIAAAKAGIEKYHIVEYPMEKKPLEKLLEDFFEEVRTALLKHDLGEHYSRYRQIKALLEMRGIQARMPFEIWVE